jgi:glycosyltransferase involved in cell wall biosynthesis
MTARVAVLIPCHNDGSLLLEAVSSIDEDEPVEIVVVDDASTDPETRAALDTVEARGATVIRLPHNVKVWHARNRGLAGIRAAYVFPLDADDVLLPGSLAAMADQLDAHPEAAACFGDYIEFGSVEENRRIVPTTLDPFRIAYQNEFGAPLLRRSVLHEIGGWAPDDDADFGYEDWHVWMAMAERGLGGVHLGDRATYKRRLHGTRRLQLDRRRHGRLYRTLRRLHPRLFSQLPDHRRASPLPPSRKLLYPLVYGRRPRFGFERSVRVWLDRHGLWTRR